MISFETRFHCTLFRFVRLRTKSTNISHFFVVLSFFESDFWVIASSNYVVVHQPAKDMYHLINSYFFQRALFPVANNTTFLRQFLMLAPITNELPQFVTHKSRIKLHVIARFVNPTFTFDAKTYFLTFLELLGSHPIETYKAYLAIGVNNIFGVVVFFMLFFLHMLIHKIYIRVAQLLDWRGIKKINQKYLK